MMAKSLPSSEVTQALNALFFFAKPYHSWERGLNDHTNGLIRQYLPKKTSFEGVSLKTLRWIEERLNNRL
jgi:IS30 family transposase